MVFHFPKEKKKIDGLKFILTAYIVAVVHSARLYVWPTYIHPNFITSTFFSVSYIVGKFMAGWRGLVYFLMVVSLVQVGAEYTGENDFIQRINYGVIFKEDAKLFLAK